ncbi:MAG: hypothetical protein D3914_08925, partial [Candidatus Electrothrix sp. LOE2]|nr:hypothetical protein [Candidatus Electrothrix sp. LOE2]
QQMHSQGAVVRVVMNCTAAVVLLTYWKQWKQVYPNALFWLRIGGWKGESWGERELSLMGFAVCPAIVAG